MDRATGAFWRAGYSATSLEDLTAATGMNKPSLYGAFGDKHALYLAALERYTEAGRVAMLEALRPDLKLREGLQRVYDTALQFYLPPDQTARGCFLIGTAATESVEDPEVRKRLRDGLRLYDSLFEARITQARDDGEIAADADPAALAGVASAIMHTLALRSRAGEPEKVLRAIASAGIDLICEPERARSKRR
ncbi:MAG: TetR/AcrR family transcriptional regulator [Reyranellaceae bacterium]